MSTNDTIDMYKSTKVHCPMKGYHCSHILSNAETINLSW